MSQNMGEYWKYMCLTIHKTQYLYEAWSTEGFMMNSDEISKNAIVLNANEPKNNKIATQISVLPYQMKEMNEIFSAFSNL